MSWQTFIVILAGMILVMAWYANSSKRNKILCRFRRVNKTIIPKFVKMQSRYIIFDGKKFDIVPSCITFQWFTQGIVHMIFPQFVPTLDFTYNHRYPLDPNTLQPVIITPEVRNSMNKEEWVKSWGKGLTPSASKKPSFFQQYLPWVAIILVVFVGFYLYNNMQALSNHMSIIENTVKSIAK